MGTGQLTRYMLIFSHLARGREVRLAVPQEYRSRESKLIHVVSGMDQLFELSLEELDFLIEDNIVELDSANDDPELYYRTEVYRISESGFKRMKDWAQKINERQKRPPQ